MDLQTPHGPIAQLRVLGGATLSFERDPERAPASRRHPLALLVLLATAPALTLSRTRLIGLMWPEADESTGRNRLTSALYHLRQHLGRNAIASVGDTLRLDPGALDCDAWRFQEALDRGDEAAAVRLYRGPFLDAFHLPDAVEFDHYVDRHRYRLRHAYCEALETLAEQAETDGSPATSVRWWRERAAADPYDTSIALRLVEALVTAGNPEEALRVAEAHEARLRQELGAASHTELKAMLERLRALPPTPDAPPRSIAVLPLETLGDDAATAMGDGIHTDLLARLAAVTGLGVIARTTVLQYRNSGKTIAEIGRELSVDWVLEGDVQVSGHAFRVSVRLVHAGTDRQLWAEQYRGDLSAEDLFDLQANLTREIFDSLEVKVTREEREQVEAKPTRSVEAYRSWAEGRMHLDRRTAEEMNRAVDRFERAIGFDPEYVQAWVGLADALGLLHAYGFSSFDVLERAAAAIETALDLDPRSAEAHAARGRLLGGRNALEAQRELELAVALKPGYAEAHNWLSVGGHVLGRREEALESARRALNLDPLSPEVVYNFASALFINGEHERASAELRRLRELAPSYDSARFLEGIVLYEMGRHEEAASLLEGLEIAWAGAGAHTARALALIACGDLEGGRRLLEGIDPSRHPIEAGLVLAALDQTEAAWAAFEAVDFSGMDFSSTVWPTLALRYMFDAVWDPLRDDPRYVALVQRMEQSWGLGADPAVADHRGAPTR